MKNEVTTQISNIANVEVHGPTGQTRNFDDYSRDFGLLFSGRRYDECPNPLPNDFSIRYLNFREEQVAQLFVRDGRVTTVKIPSVNIVLENGVGTAPPEAWMKRFVGWLLPMWDDVADAVTQLRTIYTHLDNTETRAGSETIKFCWLPDEDDSQGWIQVGFTKHDQGVVDLRAKYVAISGK